MNRNKIARACKQEFSSVDLIKFFVYCKNKKDTLPEC